MSDLLVRKIFHICGGMVAPLAAIVFPRNLLLCGLGAGAFLLLSFETARFASPSCNSRFLALCGPYLRRQENSGVTGSTYMVISSLLTFLIFPRDIAIIAISFLAIGDAVGALVGVAFSGGKQVEKNWQGSVTCFLSCLLIGLLLNHLFLNIGISIVLIGAATATVVEALPLRINDNITIPISSAIIMSLLVCVL